MASSDKGAASAAVAGGPAHAAGHGPGEGGGTRRDFLFLAGGAFGVIGAAAVVWPLLDSLKGAERTISNDFMRERVDGAIVMVREGTGLASALKRANVLPPMMIHMVAAGERAGEVPKMLDKAAIQLEEEFDTASTVALRLLEPAIIIAMGGIVMMIVIAIMLPILRLNSLAAG